MYIKRTMESWIIKASEFFPVILITGPRQVGKTTVLQQCEQTERRYVSLDSLENRNLAKTDPALFLQRFSPPVLIDEVQYAPELFPYIKMIVDERKEKGLFWLTGSQQFEMMQNVTESLAGRVGILNLQGLSQSEKYGNPASSFFLPTLDYIEKKEKNSPKIELEELYHIIWKGSYPMLYLANGNNWEWFYDSYLQTYIGRDVKSILGVANELLFIKFMKVLAAKTASLLNYAELAREVGISETTIKSWISVLQTSGLVYLLYPYSNNLTKRVIKTPKIYFLDTGLAAYLTGWTSPQVLETGAMNGQILETYVVAEIVKSYYHNGKRPNIYFYRDRDGKEIDLIIEYDNTLYPIEIKKKSAPDSNDIKNFNILENVGRQVSKGVVLCLAQTYSYINKDNFFVPVSYI